MSKLIVSAWITLDGVFDATTMHEWFAPFDSTERQEYIRDGILAADALLLGRLTYEMLASYWPHLKHNEMGIAAKLNSMTKFVVSSSLERADWENTILIREDVAAAVRKLKEATGKEIQIEGSAELIHSLMKTDLIDEYRFLLHPVIAGKGKRFFKEEAILQQLNLVKAQAMANGVQLLCYEPKRN